MADNARIEDLRRRVQKDPSSIAFAQLAEECRRAGQYQESVDVCREGLQLYPGYLSARVTLGRALVELGDLETALAELQQVLKSAPDNLAATRAVADIHHRQGSPALALEHYRAALALARNDPDLQEMVGDLARQVEPLPTPGSADGLSFEQMQDELLGNLSAPPPARPIAVVASAPALEPVEAAAPHQGPAVDVHVVQPVELVASEPSTVAPEVVAPAAASAPVEPPIDSSATEPGDPPVVAVLEQWLEAIHVVRADRRA